MYPFDDSRFLPPAVVGERGRARYAELKTQLEPHSNNRYIAIDVVTGEYAVADSTSAAMRVLHLRQPENQLFLQKIGDEAEPELAARIFGGNNSTSVLFERKQ